MGRFTDHGLPHSTFLSGVSLPFLSQLIHSLNEYLKRRSKHVLQQMLLMKEFVFSLKVIKYKTPCSTFKLPASSKHI